MGWGVSLIHSTIMMLLSHGTTMGSDTSYDLAYQLISDILSQQDILLSVNTSSLLLGLYN